MRINRLYLWAPVAAFLVLMQSAYAAPLSLIPGYPDVSGNINVGYTYWAADQCWNNAHTLSGTCTGTGGSYKNLNGVRYNAGGTLHFTSADGIMFMNDTGTGFEGFTGTYSVVAKFDVNGNFVSTGSSLTITNSSTINTVHYAGSSSTTSIAPGTLLSSISLFGFNFAGTGAAGGFEFQANYLSGALASLGYTLAGAKENPITISSGAVGSTTDWTTANMMKHNFSGYGSTNTWVPIPAAVWLFGSGVLGLAAFVRRRNKSL